MVNLKKVRLSMIGINYETFSRNEKYIPRREGSGYQQMDEFLQEERTIKEIIEKGFEIWEDITTPYQYLEELEKAGGLGRNSHPNKPKIREIVHV